MGRIAEALQRAQQERASRLEGDSAPACDGAGVSFMEADAFAGTATLDPDAGESTAAPGGLDTSAVRPMSLAATPVLPDAVDPRVVAFHDPASAIAEKYRSIRTRLLTGNPSGGARAIAITSTLPREGKTITTGNLGFSLAELRHLRVAVVDLDFRQRGLSHLFGSARRVGIADALSGRAALNEACVPVVRENLYLVPAGDSGDASPSELLAGNRAVRLFKELGERFHYTLVDSPPVNTSADIGLIASLCHSVVIVIRMGRTPEPLLCRCIRLLQANHVKITGSILAGYCDRTMGYADPHDYYQADV